MSEDGSLPSRQAVAAELERRLREPPPGRVQVLTGPRQAGKTTLLLSSSFAERDLGGLLEFCRRDPEFQPLVLCSRERVEDSIPGVRLMYWGDFLLGKPLPE
jgi:predicted AAA+ superfamily ATPase